jgi:dTDP-N-acetylfucosamine:lipid II N-acetylfucosaminyltransferase
MDSLFEKEYILKTANMLHIFDDEKFIDGAINLFKLDSSFKHKYIVLTPNIQNLNYVNSSEVILIEYDRKKFIDKIKNIIVQNDIKIVAVHALNQPKWQLINSLGNNYILVWFVFGYDLYNHWKPFQKGLYEKQTKNYVNGFKSKKLVLLESIIRNPFIYKTITYIPFKKLRYSKFRFLKILKSNHPNQFYQAVKKIDYVAPVLKSEMNLLHKVNSKLKYLPFSYDSVNNFSSGIDSINENLKCNILVGNSATPTNNHLEVFLKLSKLNLNGRKIIVPLSYGDNDYRDFILKKGKEILGSNFLPILDFIPLKEYNQILQSCSVAIFNHIRQQALGNLMVMVAIGAKVFVNKKSLVYSEFLEVGLNILNTDELSEDNLSSKLNKEQKLMNNAKVYELYGKDVVEIKVNQLLETLSIQLLKLKN